MLKNEKLIFTVFGVFIFTILLCAIFIKLKKNTRYICKKNRNIFPIIQFDIPVINSGNNGINGNNGIFVQETCIAEEVIMAEVVAVK